MPLVRRLMHPLSPRPGGSAGTVKRDDLSGLINAAITPAGDTLAGLGTVSFEADHLVLARYLLGRSGRDDLR